MTILVRIFAVKRDDVGAATHARPFEVDAAARTVRSFAGALSARSAADVVGRP